MKIFPEEILENSSEVFKFKHTVTSKIIYSILLILLLVCFIALPFVKVDIYTSSQGIIKPDLERSIIKSINSGRVLYSISEDNKNVSKGDTILIIESSIIEEQLNFSKNQISEANQYIYDLNYLLRTENPEIEKIISDKYKSDLIEFNQILLEAKTKLQRLEKQFTRNKILFEKGVIAASEYESIESEYNLSKSNIQTLKKQQRNRWQSQHLTFAENLRDFQSNKNQLLENKSQYFITAPVSGTIMNSKPLFKGSFISQGDQLAEISPSTDLIGECYISPSDIGLINSNNPVTFQIDAYNYNQWGLAHGKILEINKDIELVENTPLFKIKCKLNEQHLSLKNGIKGDLKKGMTFSARFLITERSLYQLLYDKVDDWINPANS